MQQVWKQLARQSFMVSSVHSRRLLSFKSLSSSSISSIPTIRFFSSQSLEAKQEAPQEIDIEAQRKRQGIDMAFSMQKHSYVLAFPWNFPEIIQDFEADYRTFSPSSFWHRFMESQALREVNDLFREFHQLVALNDMRWIKDICEGTLADYVKQSVYRIRFHGLGIEMANLTVHQPSIKVLKVEIAHGVDVQRANNKPADHYTTSKSSLFGAPLTTYVPSVPFDSRSALDHLDSAHKPYLVALTLLVESPMKLYVQNQNYSAVLFGSNDSEQVKNVIRVEANMRWHDMLKVLPVQNKPSVGWKLTDINNVMNENPVCRK